MNILLFELKKLKLNIIIWTSLLLIIFLALFTLYPAYYDNQENVLEILSGLSSEALGALNINLDTLFTPIGFYSFIFVYITFVGALYAGILGLRIMINDNMENASSFILTKPLSRKKILSNKIYASIIALVITHIFYQIISILLIFIIRGNHSFSFAQLFLINLSLLFIQITFLSICLVIGSYIRKPKTIVVVSIIVIFAFYLLSIIENIINNFILRYLNPFSYFKANDILVNGTYNQSFIIATIFIVFFCFNFAYGCYENDDIMEG